MLPAGTLPDPTAFYIQEIGAVLFGLVFFFVYRQSRAVYFGLWAIAWVLRLLAAFFGFEMLRTMHSGWLAPYATFEFAFVIVLISAARAGFASEMRDWRTVLRLIAILPVFVALVWAIGRSAGIEAYHGTHAVVLALVYLYNYRSLRHRGIGGRVFRFSLLLLSAVFVEHAVMLAYLYRNGGAPLWARYLHNEAYLDFVLHCVLAFSGMAMWSESQMDRVRDLANEVAALRRDRSPSRDLDHLTGLLNQAALTHRIEEMESLDGVVAVCDMDNFKDINDRYGHLVGDEILRNIGHLLQTSIRQSDEAFRWGGDEFVILFHKQHAEVANRRMGDIEARLREFQVRGLGALPISFSWGTAEAAGRRLRDTLDEADRNMYVLKRTRAGAHSGERKR